MKIYAIVGTAQQTIVDDIVAYIPQNNEILMQSERPSAEHIASQESDWIVEGQLLDELKTKKLQQITAWTSLAITGGFISTCTGSEVHYDSDIDTQITMQGIALNANTEQFVVEYPAGCPVRGYKKVDDSFEAEKTIQYLNPEQVLLFCADLSKHIGAQKQRGWELQEVVKVAETKEELAQIIW